MWTAESPGRVVQWLLRGVGLLSGRITVNTKAQSQIPEQKCFVNAVGERITFLIFFLDLDIISGSFFFGPKKHWTYDCRFVSF